jgi:hypothetical protein
MLDVNSVLFGGGGGLYSVNVGDVSEVSEALDTEDGGGVYLQKIGNITHIHMVQEPENRFNITNKSP